MTSYGVLVLSRGLAYQQKNIVAAVYGSPSKQNGKAGESMKIGPPKKAAKAAASAPEKSDVPRTSTRRGAAAARPRSPSESTSSPPPPPPARVTRRKSISTPAENAEAGPSRATTSASPTKLMRTPSKRSAATKATQKLHDVIMPDVISFQKEMKKGAVRVAHEDELASKGKTPAKGRKRPSVGSVGPEGEEDEEDEEEMPERKKRKTGDVEAVEKDKGRGKKKGAGARKSAAESEDESQEAGPSKKSGTGAAADGALLQAKNVRIMTTQLSLPDDVVKVSIGLGSVGCRAHG